MKFGSVQITYNPNAKEPRNKQVLLPLSSDDDSNSPHWQLGGTSLPLCSCSLPIQGLLVHLSIMACEPPCCRDGITIGELKKEKKKKKKFYEMICEPMSDNGAERAPKQTPENGEERERDGRETKKLATRRIFPIVTHGGETAMVWLHSLTPLGLLAPSPAARLAPSLKNRLAGMRTK
ncbi:hypothetical protein L209DRAFT_750286 [Thermothelomyces heterothallicus CBS 203.75]